MCVCKEKGESERKRKEKQELTKQSISPTWRDFAISSRKGVGLTMLYDYMREEQLPLMFELETKASEEGTCRRREIGK